MSWTCTSSSESTTAPTSSATGCALLALARLDRWEWLKNVLTESAYRRFFNATMDNIQAGYEAGTSGSAASRRTTSALVPF